ncbi:MAG: CoA-transferase [Chloroflexota bacterium]|nr:CoA-transferase [Chloroflexota bacterium]
MVEMGYYGNAPRPAEPFVLNFGNFPTCKMLTETLDTIGVFACGATNRCIGVLGGAQVDRFGNINSTKISEEQYLAGSGGANDVASGAREVAVVMQQSRQRFLEKVPYITAPGARVRTLVSSMGVFEKLGDDEEFTLTKYFANPAFASKQEVIENIKDNCGWAVRVSQGLKEVPAPTAEELRLLRVFDPKKYYTR